MPIGSLTTMATSAATLATILSEVSKRYDIPEGEMTKLLKGKGLLPKKMTEAPAKGPKSVFASKAAEELAAEHGLDLDSGSGKNGKVTLKDVKEAIAPSAPKVNASAAALKYVRDNGLDISKIASGSGKEGRIVLSDVKDLKEPDSESGSDSDSDSDSAELDPKMLTPEARKIVKKYDLDCDDLCDAGVTGTGKGGKITGKDLAKLVKELEKEA